MLARLLRQAAGLPSLARCRAAPLSTTPQLQGLQDIIPTIPKEDEKRPATGREWKAADLRNKSWDDLHKLWYVLLKERNMLQSEKLAYTQARKQMPDPFRLTKVRKAMNRIKQVMSERLNEHEDPTLRLKLKAFIDSM